MELPSSRTNHALPPEPVAAEVLPRRCEWECDCSGQAWGELFPEYTANLCCLPCICFTFCGGARMTHYCFATLSMMTIAYPVINLILFPLHYCKLFMTGSNSELIRARIFWCRFLCCRCCCKRFNSDSVADEVSMEYSPGTNTNFSVFLCTEMYGKLTSAAAIHAFILGYPSGINCGHLLDGNHDCPGCFPHTTGPQPSAHYLNLYLLLLCGANPNLRLGSDYLQRNVTSQTPLHLVASRLQRGRKRLANAASSQPWWDWISFARYWYFQTSACTSVNSRSAHHYFSYGGRGEVPDYEYLHNHPIDVCGYASYYLGKMSIGYGCCCCHHADMPYDLVTTTNLHAAELLIRYGADASLRDSNDRTPLETIDDADIRGRLQQAMDAGRASREKEVAAENECGGEGI